MQEGVCVEKKVARKSTRTMSGRNWAAALMLVTCGIFLIYAVGGQAWHLILHKLVRVEFLVPATLKRAEPVKCILIKDETTVTAPAGGKFSLAAAEGSRVRTGQVIGKIVTLADESGGEYNIELRAPRTGLVCTHLDNYENVLKPGNIDALDMTQLQKISDNNKPGDTAQKGRPAVKIVDNLSPVLIYFQAPEKIPAGKTEKGSSITLLWQGREMTARLEAVKTSAGITGLYAVINNYPDDILHLRNVDMELLLERVAGFTVPLAALVDKNGAKGIYISSRHKVEWHPVKVQGSSGTESLITGDGLGPEIRYIKNPRWVRAGDRVE
jgi:putative membrane fusion protein